MHLLQGNHQVLSVTPDGHPVGEQPCQRVQSIGSSGRDELLQHPTQEQEHSNDGSGGILADDERRCRGKRDGNISREIALADALDGRPPDVDRANQSRRQVEPGMRVGRVDDSIRSLDGGGNEQQQAHRCKNGAGIEQKVTIASNEAPSSTHTEHTRALKTRKRRK